jgi:hypothetical protein
MPTATPRANSKSQQKRIAAQTAPPMRKLPASNDPTGDPPPPQQAKPTSYAIVVNVDWQNLPLQLARNAFEQLSKEYETAAKILNERATTKPGEQFSCFMAGKPNCCQIGKVYSNMPRFTDLAYKAPRGGYKDLRTGQITPEGLAVRVDICSENCYMRYNEVLIAERRERMNPAVNG